MVSVCGYYCSLCEITLKTKKGWLNHLLSPDHQTEAREDLISWDLPTKERVLVAFDKFSVATEKVLGAFSEKDGRSNLSGFVWSENRRRMGLLLFESREKVNEVWTSLTSSELRIGSYHTLQLKKAIDYLDLEWEGLIMRDFRSGFSLVVKSDLKTEMNEDRTPLPPSKRLKLEYTDSEESDRSSSSDDNEVEQDDNRWIMKLEQEEMARFNFRSQFDTICHDIEIRAGVYKEAVNIMEKCQKILAESFPSCGVYMFRNWYLKLRGQGASELLLYVDADGVLGSESDGTAFIMGKALKPSRKVLKSLFTSPSAQRLFPGLQCFLQMRLDRILGFTDYSQLHFEDVASNIKFALVTDPAFAVEAQTCRLLNYLLDFDPRARPFLTLIFYWAEQNGVKISDSTITRDDPHLSYAFAPEPAGLEWMVVFFLCHKGILPSPRTILERTPKPKILYNWGKYLKRNDIACRMDSEFAEGWSVAAAEMPNLPIVGSNEFVLHLVKLSQEFFTFYGQLRWTPQQWILNTKDGELLKNEDVLKSSPQNLRIRLTQQERIQLRNQEGNLTKRHKTMNGLANRRLTILHPLILQWTIPCDEDNFFGKISFDMLDMANRIENWFPTASRSGEAADITNLTTLENLFGA